MEDPLSDSVKERLVEERIYNEGESSCRLNDDGASNAEDAEKNDSNPADVVDAETNNGNPTDAEDTEQNNHNPIRARDAEKNDNDPTDAADAETSRTPNDAEDAEEDNNEPIDAGDADKNSSDPNDPLDPLKPKLGMMFGSVDEAFQFYKAYGHCMGFQVVRKTNHNIDNIRYRSTFQCRQGGIPRIKKGAKRRRRPVLRSGCRAKMVIRDDNLQDQWRVHIVELEHNHQLDPPDRVRFMKCFREMPVSLKNQLQINEEVISKILPQGRGDLNCLFTETDKNRESETSQAKLGEGEAGALMRFFENMQAQNSNFFFSWDMNKEGRLRNVFWADARSRMAYQYFNDIIAFDTTYLTDPYRVPLTTFVGVNHHGQSVLLGCGLLADETTETYIWLFRKWLRFMNYKPPDALITDHCEAIRGAVAEVLPHARHRFCLWQIMRKIPTKLGEMEEKDAISLLLHKAVFDSLTVSEFERRWGEIIQHYRLEDNMWLSTLYEDRKQWVPVYVKDTFWAGISATERNESMINFFDGCVTSETSLEMFFEKYASTLRSKIEEEAQEDFRSFHTKPQLVSRLQFEEQIAKVYTMNMFHMFQNEAKQSMQLNSYAINRSGPMVTYFVTEFARGERVDYEVLYNNSEEDVWCVCRLFQFRGILCRHALCVLRQELVMLIPSKYILKRWRKDFKRLHASMFSPELASTHERSVYDNLYMHGYQYFANIVEIGAIDLNLKDFALSIMKEAKDKIIKYEESCERREVDDNKGVSKNDGAPKAPRGRPPKKRFANENEMAVSVVKKKRGRPPKKRLANETEMAVSNVMKGPDNEISTDPSRLMDLRSDYSANVHENQINIEWPENPIWRQENFGYRQVQQNQSNPTWAMTPNGTQQNFANGVQENLSNTVLPVMPDGTHGNFANRVESIPVDNHTPYIQWPGFGNLDASRRA